MFALFFALAMVSTVVVFATARKAGKALNATYQRVIVASPTVLDTASVYKAPAIVNPVGRVRCAMRRTARTQHAPTTVPVSKVNAIAKPAGKDNTVI